MIKSQTQTIKHILQDAMLRIPYFISIEPTDTLAMLYSSQIMALIESDTFRGILSTHKKLYYQSETLIPVKTLIIVFHNIDFAQMFYQQHNICNSLSEDITKQNEERNTFITGNFINSLVQVQQNNSIVTSATTKFKTKIHFCKDISNLNGILFEKGKIAVQFPDSVPLRKIIREVSKLVVMEGIRAEEELKKKIQEEPVLEFLDHTTISSENVFYRWRVYSYLQGDGDVNYRKQPFQIVVDRASWYPPDEFVKEKFHYRILNQNEREFFTNLLYHLTTKKANIEEAMSFSLINMEGFIDIASIIAVVFADLCQKPGVTEIKLLPIFYLISDIIFNSPWLGYRDVFGLLLPQLLYKLSINIPQIDKVKHLLEIWQKRYIFQEEYFKGLFFIFEKNRENKFFSHISHEIFKKTDEEIEEMIYRYGLPYNSEQKVNRQNLIAILSSSNTEESGINPPELGPYDGEQLVEKDLMKIKSKACKVFTCSGASVKSLFQKIKAPGSLSIDKQ